MAAPRGRLCLSGHPVPACGLAPAAPHVKPPPPSSACSWASVPLSRQQVSLALSSRIQPSSVSSAGAAKGKRLAAGWLGMQRACRTVGVWLCRLRGALKEYLPPHAHLPCSACAGARHLHKNIGGAVTLHLDASAHIIVNHSADPTETRFRGVGATSS